MTPPPPRPQRPSTWVPEVLERLEARERGRQQKQLPLHLLQLGQAGGGPDLAGPQQLHPRTRHGGQLRQGVEHVDARAVTHVDEKAAHAGEAAQAQEVEHALGGGGGGR